jgi:uncharacterized protein (DUF488 family)
MPTPLLYTIGHSNHPAGHFTALLQRHGIRLLADIRSQPASRFSPQFNRTALANLLAASGMAYRWLGDRLGGRPQDPAAYRPDGRPDYAAMAASAAFSEGIDELLAGAATLPTVIMCAERDPQKCHRNQLVTPALLARGAAVQHILGDGTLSAAAPQQSPAQQYRLFD